MVPIVTAGDDIAIKATLLSNGAAYDVSSASLIQAALLGPSGNTLIALTTQSSQTTGADWTNGVVMVLFPKATTASLKAGSAYLEVQVTLNTKKSTCPLQLIQIQEGL